MRSSSARWHHSWSPSHSYIPKKILCDLGTASTSELFAELAKLLEVQLQHASPKHAQTIGVVERSHSCLKRILKLNTTEQWSNWHKYTELACFIHNTSYHSVIHCTPSSLFHGREPLKPLDLRFSSHAISRLDTSSDFVTTLQDAISQEFRETKDKLVCMYHRYRTYYDQKAAANPIAEKTYCLLLNPKLTTQSDFTAKSMHTWLPLFRVKSQLTHSNYIIRRVGTNFTQCVHRVRLRPFTLNGAVDDLPDIDPNNFIPDSSLKRFRSEPELFDVELPALFATTRDDLPDRETPKYVHPVQTTLSLPVHVLARADEDEAHPLAVSSTCSSP